MGSLEWSSLTPLHWVAIAMALVSGIVHLVLGIEFAPHPMGITFLLAAGGFAGGVVLVISDYRRRLLYLAGIPYTAVQIVGWYVVNRPQALGDLSIPGVVDKLAQVLLIVALILLYRRES